MKKENKDYSLASAQLFALKYFPVDDPNDIEMQNAIQELVKKCVECGYKFALKSIKQDDSRENNKTP